MKSPATTMSKSPDSRARRILLAVLFGTLSSALFACAPAPPVFLSASDCQQLFPKSWKKGVNSAPLPKAKTVGDLAAFGDAQTGQLDIANLRFGEAIEICEHADALLKKAAAAAQPRPWWKFW